MEDGKSDQWHRALQLVTFIAVGATGLLGIDLGPIDNAITKVAEVALQLFELGVLFNVGPLVHTKILRGKPVVGKTFSILPAP